VRWSKVRRATYSLSAGLIFTLGLAPFDLKIASLLSLAMLYGALVNQTAKEGALMGWLYGAGFFGAGVSWVFVSIHVYGGAPTSLAILLTFIFCGGLAVLPAIQAAIFCHLQPKNVLQRGLFFAGLWVTFEWVRTWLLTGFPWLFAGYASIDTPLAGWAPVLGVLGVSLLIALSAAGLAEIFFTRDRRTAFIWISWSFSLLLVGTLLEQINWTTSTGNKAKAVVYQPNTSLFDKWDPNNTQAILEDYLAHAQFHTPDTDLLIWPEGALPFYLDQAPNYIARLNELGVANDASIVLGVATREGSQRFNSIVTLGNVTDEYRKQKLVPFGEFVPLESQLRGLIGFFDLPMSNFSRGGKDQGSLLTGIGELAPFICYEVVYPDFVAKRSRTSQILVTISNDAWFGTSHGPHQHFQMVRFRSLELQKPTIRGANNGITAVVLPTGEVEKALPQFEKGNLILSVEPHEGLTPFARWGSGPVILVSLLLSLPSITSTAASVVRKIGIKAQR
jgi:apolipoprotein N-acyltransferase